MPSESGPQTSTIGISEDGMQSSWPIPLPFALPCNSNCVSSDGDLHASIRAITLLIMMSDGASYVLASRSDDEPVSEQFDSIMPRLTSSRSIRELRSCTIWLFAVSGRLYSQRVLSQNLMLFAATPSAYSNISRIQNDKSHRSCRVQDS